ncbi:iron(III) ABC transporter permease [Nitrospira sp.]|nr:iron(III) ABC transporter permease [Nitrospira sp.]
MTASVLRHHALSPMQVLVVGIAGLLSLPLLYVMYRALTADTAIWGRLWRTRLPELLWNTFSLACSVGLLTFALGVSLAWLVTRLDFPGRRIWEWALVLPLAMPTYVLAYVYSYLLGTHGPVDRFWQAIAGPGTHIFAPQSFWGVTVVMALDTFPFVYLLTRTALLSMNVSFEEVARSCGIRPWQTFLRVTLPLLRPSIFAGVSLVVLYVVSDFGAVSLLRYQTLTYAVYQQMTGRYDYAAASVLSVLLVVFAIVFFASERWFRNRSRFYQTGGRFRRPTPQPLSLAGRMGALVITASTFLLSFGIPAGLLMWWSTDAFQEGLLDHRFIEFTWNTILLSGMAASSAVLLGIPVAYLATRQPTWLNHVCLHATYAGYVLPGPVAALALLVLAIAVVPGVYGTVYLLILAYVVHYLPVGLQSLEPAIQQVTPNVEEAARTLGCNIGGALRRVTIPLIWNGFVSAWTLMFLQCMKELPATLLLRPVGFDTLAVRVWLEASEELYTSAAAPALLIVVLSLPALALLVARDWKNTEIAT